MARYAAGQPVRVSTEVRDTSGNLTTPGSILLRVRKPDGTYLPDYTSPTADSTGKYHQDIGATDLTALGHYQYAWITTGTAAGVSPPAAFEVVDPFMPSHVTFGDVKARLNLSASSDDEIQAMIAAAVSEQERWVGAVAPRTVTGTFYAHEHGLVLDSSATVNRPILSITSATLNGTAVDISTWTVKGDGTAGIIRPYTYSGYWGSYGWNAWHGWRGYPYLVTYVAGRNPVPQDLVEAALLRVAHSYATQRGGGGGGQIIGSSSGDIPEPAGSDFLLMLRAQDKEAPYRLPSIA